MRPDVCEICEKEGVTHKIQCGHTFHHDCIRGWVYRGNDYCPICKSHLEMKDISEIGTSSSGSVGSNKSEEKKSDSSDEGKKSITSLDISKKSNETGLKRRKKTRKDKTSNIEKMNVMEVKKEPVEEEGNQTFKEEIDLNYDTFN